MFGYIHHAMCDEYNGNPSCDEKPNFLPLSMASDGSYFALPPVSGLHWAVMD